MKSWFAAYELSEEETKKKVNTIESKTSQNQCNAYNNNHPIELTLRNFYVNLVKCHKVLNELIAFIRDYDTRFPSEFSLDSLCIVGVRVGVRILLYDVNKYVFCIEIISRWDQLRAICVHERNNIKTICMWARIKSLASFSPPHSRTAFIQTIYCWRCWTFALTSICSASIFFLSFFFFLLHKRV